MKILANDGLASEGVNALKEAGFSVTTDKTEQDQLIEVINRENYEVLLVRSATKVRKDIIDACPNLKLIGRGGVGMDNIDVAYAREKGIKVINTPAASSLSVAELVMSHLFSVVRFLHDSNRQMPSHGENDFNGLKKKYAKGIELRGKTLGIIGFGRIGQAVAKYALGNGMKVIASDALPLDVEIQIDIAGISSVKVPIKTTSLENVIASADIITIHTPAQKDGNPVLGEAEINSMKDGVILINASRGGIIDEDALCNALDSGKIRAAGIDVFKNEPTPSKKILSHSKISLTPHIGAATGEAQDRVAAELASQIIEMFQPA